jgi:predicted translin family RNA/ssDNA-binding protein
MHVTPSETTFRLLRELSKLTGTAPATMVRELLDEATPALETMLEAVRMMKDRPAQAQAAMARLAAASVRDLSQAQLDLDAALQKKPGRKPASKGREATNTG